MIVIDATSRCLRDDVIRHILSAISSRYIDTRYAIDDVAAITMLNYYIDDITRTAPYAMLLSMIYDDVYVVDIDRLFYH